MGRWERYFQVRLTQCDYKIPGLIFVIYDKIYKLLFHLLLTSFYTIFIALVMTLESSLKPSWATFYSSLGSIHILDFSSYNHNYVLYKKQMIGQD